MDPLLIQLAKGQRGAFTTQQAAGLGVGEPELRAMARAGVCRRLARGLYVVQQASVAGDHNRSHLQLAVGGLLLYPDAALSQDSALLARRLPVWRPDPRLAHLVRPVRRRVRRSGFVIEPWVDEITTTKVGPAVTEACAVVQVARDKGIVAAVMAGDAALHRGSMSMGQLQAAYDGVRGWPWATRVKPVITLVDSRSESPGESWTRVICLVGGIEVEPQVEVYDRAGELVGRLDLRVKGVKVALEFDGRVKYQDGGPDALWREKLREDRLRALGWIVIRVVWADLQNPARLLATIRAAVQGAQAVA